MIKGMHGMFYSANAEELRKFFKDVLGLPFTDVGEGWLIFDLPEGELGVHSVDPNKGPGPGAMDVSFYCDEIKKTVEQLRAKGAQFDGDIHDVGYGLVANMMAPGGLKIQLYQPRYVKKSQTKKAKREPISKSKSKSKAKAKVAKKAKAIPKSRPKSGTKKAAKATSKKKSSKASKKKK